VLTAMTIMSLFDQDGNDVPYW